MRPDRYDELTEIWETIKKHIYKEHPSETHNIGQRYQRDPY